MATKEKINLLEVIPCRNEHIKAEQEGETIVLSFPRFKRSWMSRYLLPKGMSKDIHVRLEEHGTAVWNLIVQSPNQKIPDRKTKCVIKTHINIKQNVIFSAKLKPV